MLVDARGEFDSGALARLAANVASIGAAEAIDAAREAGDDVPQGRDLGAAIARVRESHIAMAQR